MKKILLAIVLSFSFTIPAFAQHESYGGPGPVPGPAIGTSTGTAYDGGLGAALAATINGSQTAHYVYAAPSGASGAPSWRQLTNTDISGLGTAAVVNTGTAGASLCLANAACTWSGAPIFSASGSTFGSASTAHTMKVEGPAGSSKGSQFTDGGGATNVRWFAGMDSTSETGLNNGGNYWIVPYSDTGTYGGTAILKANRGTGPDGSGPPQMQISPFTVTNVYAGQDNGFDGVYQDYGPVVEPTYNLGANPVSVTSGSAIATITWTNCCGGTNDPPLTFINDDWVYLSGLTAVGGVTPSGWYQATQIASNNNQFTITLASSATSTATGGGSAGTIRPSFATVQNVVYSIEKTGAGGGFADQNEYIYYCNPEFSDPNLAVNCQQTFTRFVTPNDPTGVMNWTAQEWEDELYDRWTGAGFAPILHNQLHPMAGILIGPHRSTPDANGGGGQGYNWSNLIVAFGANDSIGRLGSFTVIDQEPNSLASVYDDPNGHGGVGYVAYGSYSDLPANPFYVGTSTGNVVVTLGNFSVNGNIQVGDTFWLSGTYTLNGLTFGNATYTVTAFSYSGKTLTFAPGGTSGTSPVNGGGTGDWLSMAKQVPSTVIDAYGEYKHGVIFTENNFKSDDGLLIHTSPGNGIGWDDGTGIASITGAEVSAGNVSISLAPAGTGVIGATGHIASTGTSPTVANGTLDATATDTKGTVTEGTTVTSDTITWHTAYASAPDCIVTSPTGSVATSYTPSTTTLVINNASATGDKFTYQCFQ